MIFYFNQEKNTVTLLTFCRNNHFIKVSINQTNKLTFTFKLLNGFLYRGIYFLQNILFTYNG